MNLKRVSEYLSPNEIKILPWLENDLIDVCRKSNLDKTSVLRALEYLNDKKIINLSFTEKKVVELGINGALYKKKGLPERRLMQFLSEKRMTSHKELKKESGLTEDEIKVSMGILKRRDLIKMEKGKIIFNAEKKEVYKRTPEETFLDVLPVNEDSLSATQKEILKSLLKRRDLIKLKNEKTAEIKITESGKKIIRSETDRENMIELITPAMLKKEKLWKGKKFRRYEVASSVPSIHGGKRHFVNQASDYARKIWTEFGFKEMEGNLIIPSFWNFDALFTAQDHPVREMQDTFFIDKKIPLKDGKIVSKVKESHEKGTGGSTGWQCEWREEESKKLVLRTHTTSVSVQALAKLDVGKLPAKFFAIGKCFRNETIDWSHGFEFNQTEGIVVDRNANFRHLLGYLKEFFRKMGFEKIRFRPAYFPYTEPSVEIDVFHPGKKTWLELGGAGIFRPEVVIPLLNENVPVLAWGPGLDRTLMDYYGIEDIRKLYKNDVTLLRKTKFWLKD